jgi:predicted dehydrogenase
MIAAARAKDVTLGVAYYRRTYPKMRKVKELIESGVLGTPTWVSIATHSWFNPSREDPKHWRVERLRSGGGGALADIGVHRLDLLDFWMGPSKVVSAQLQHLVHAYEVEDGSSILLELRNGAPVHAYFAWNSKTVTDRVELVGSEGKIIADPLDLEPLTILRGTERRELSIPRPQNPHLPLVEDFVRAVQEKRAPICDGEAGLRTNQLLRDALKCGMGSRE